MHDCVYSAHDVIMPWTYFPHCGYQGFPTQMASNAWWAKVVTVLLACIIFLTNSGVAGEMRYSCDVGMMRSSATENTASFVRQQAKTLLLTHLPLCRIYASVNWVSIGSGNGLLPVRRQAITWTNAGLFSIGLLGTNFSEIPIWILVFSFKKMHLKLSSAEMAAILSRGSWVNNEDVHVQQPIK